MDALRAKKSIFHIVKYILIITVLVCMAFAFLSTRQLNQSIDMGNRRIILNYANQVVFRLHDMFERVDISLGELSRELEVMEAVTQEALMKRLEDYDETWGMDISGLMYENNQNCLLDGTPVFFENEISLRDVFSYSEKLNISRQIVDGEDMLVFAKPCKKQVGVQTVNGVFTAIRLERLEALLGDYGYGTGSFLALTQTNGDNIWKQGDGSADGTGNCFLDLENLNVSQQDTVLQMKTRMSVSMDGTISYERDDQKYYMAYVPLGVNYWYLLVSARSASIDLTELSQQHFFISTLLVAVILVMGLAGIVYLFQRNRSISLHNEQLKKATALANQANIAKRDFLAKVSHEIRTPLNGVMGMIALAKEDCPDQAKCLEHLEKAAVSARYLLALINEVLDMSQIESGNQKLAVDTVDMELLLEEVRTYLEISAHQKKQTVEISTNTLKHRYFLGDYLRLKQILTNLTTNAVKYTPDSGRIRLEIGESEDARLFFCVEDNGEGIAPECEEAIFKPFEQAGHKRKGGVGLGLSIVHSYVDLMGGQIAVKSELGVGSKFTVILPLRVAELSENHEKPEHSPDLKGVSILLAEDNELNAEIAIALLKSKGAEVTLVSDGEQAVKAFEEAAPGTYRVILMDIQMPGMNGIEATKAIRNLSHPEAADILILAMTANAFKEQQDEMLQAGMNDCMYKPIDIDKVCACINRWIGEE